ncbi:thioredoxin family protein [Nonlabens sp. Ci31]|jgi:thioredoxin 1|uniref:thioredoxin family protein n=1 Tax=Nonlabens sp. Ci31 TaxID=2608253 RepID=UPI0014637762|nr:thioredoxin family protein [Nonlabens sp. Ci31]QJP33549.1 thioredoxin family protein [Nonlabens sp. Ci31]
MSKFGELISANVPVLFNFFTNWNEDTVAMNAVLRNVAAALGDKAKVIKIDIEKNQELSEALRIKGVPTFIIYKNGEMKWRQSGAQDDNTLIHQLQKFH